MHRAGNFHLKFLAIDRRTLFIPGKNADRVVAATAAKTEVYGLRHGDPPCVMSGLLTGFFFLYQASDMAILMPGSTDRGGINAKKTFVDTKRFKNR
jgi:hypothetical protein